MRLSPDRVVVMHKTSRLEFERKRNKHLSESQLQTEVNAGTDDRFSIIVGTSARRVLHACTYMMIGSMQVGCQLNLPTCADFNFYC